jgi:sugar/nucleoside kinase (ribokinase family)
LRRARAAGMTTSLDTGWDAEGRWLADVGPCLPYTDLFFVNETEAGMLSKLVPHEGAREFHRLGATCVLLKLGGAGCILLDHGTEHEIRGFSADVVDTTGAGDCFAGGLLAGLSRGMPLPEATRFACAVGALSVQTLGSVTGLLGFDETLEWMRLQHTI